MSKELETTLEDEIAKNRITTYENCCMLSKIQYWQQCQCYSCW